MYHAVPTPLSRNKSLVEVFERHWNQLVSEGEAVFALQGDGRKLLEQAEQQALMPEIAAQERDCFL